MTKLDDVNRIGALLQIVELAVKQPSLGAIQNSAMTELQDINHALTQKAKQAGPAPTGQVTAEAPENERRV